MAGGLGLGVLVYGFVRLVEGATPQAWPRSAVLAMLTGLLVGLTICLAIKLALRHAARELYTFAVELTDTTLPAPVALGDDDVVYMRETLSTALAFMPRPEDLPRLARDLGEDMEVEAALERAAGELARHMPIQGALLLVLDGERSLLVPAAHWGLAHLDRPITLDLESTAIGRALIERRETDYSGLQVRELLPLAQGPGPVTVFCLPQTVRGQPFATLCLVAQGGEVRLSAEQRAFARGVADLLTLAVQSSLHRRLFAREGERLLAFEQLGGLLAGSERIERALEQVLRVAARVTESAHGSLLLLEPDESRVRFRVTLKEGDMLPLGVTAAPILKHGLAGWALRERRADIIDDTERDARWLPVPGLEAMRSVLVVPLLYGERAFGVLTLADPTPRHYSRRSLALCSALSAYAVTILARMQFQEMATPGSAVIARRLFEGHLSPSSLAVIVADSAALQSVLDPRSRELVALWVGLRGLNRVELTPAQLLDQVITPAVAALAAIGHEHQGYLSVGVDGAVLMLFGYPAAPGDSRVRALRAAQAVQITARRLRGRWRSQLGQEIGMSAGVASGAAVTGLIGDARLSAVAAFGGPIAEAARIQRLARADEVLVTDTLAASFGAEGLFPLEQLAPLSSEGDAPRSVYRLAPGRG